MANERKTESLVRKLLSDNGYYDNDNIKIEEQISDKEEVNNLLQYASKSGSGKGYPEFIISFYDNMDNIVVIECKADIKKHDSGGTREKYKDYAVDGVLCYARNLKKRFNVMAIAVSGETEREMKVSHFLWLKNKQIYKDVSDKHLLTPKSLFNIIKEQSLPISEEELVKKAIEYNEKLHSYSIPEVERCTLISSILVALQSTAFADGYKNHHKDMDLDEDNNSTFSPNEALIDDLISACNNVLRRNGISDEKRKTISREYEKIIQNHTLKSKTIRVNKANCRNTILRDLIDDISINIMPYVDSEVFDVLGQFYTQFIRYAGSDSKTGLVLTPSHITDLFCELADLNENDIVFDPCCGTGGFLVSAMKYMLNQSNSLEKHKEIKSKQLIGIERRADMFSHACSNMMMRGDGKSHIHFGDCFDDELKILVKKEKPNKTFLNPPYDIGESGQLEFIENAMDCMVKDGICIAICQMSTVVSVKQSTIEIRKRLLEKHTLEAVLSMPIDLFHPVGVVTCIIILKAHSPHHKAKESFFGYFKDDGFVKVKNRGRTDRNNRWNEIKTKWLEAYINRRNIEGLSVTKSVNYSSEWCAESYMKTDYSTLTRHDFEKEVKKFALYKLMLDLGQNQKDENEA